LPNPRHRRRLRRLGFLRIGHQVLLLVLPLLLVPLLLLALLLPGAAQLLWAALRLLRQPGPAEVGEEYLGAGRRNYTRTSRRRRRRRRRRKTVTFTAAILPEAGQKEERAWRRRGLAQDPQCRAL
jgi:hypothetical protein